MIHVDTVHWTHRAKAATADEAAADVLNVTMLLHASWGDCDRIYSIPQVTP